MMAFTRLLYENVSGAGGIEDEVTLANGTEMSAIHLNMEGNIDHSENSLDVLTFTNLSYGDESFEYIFDRKDVRIMFLILYTVVFCCCFFGNLMVILVVSLHWRMRSITNFCLANLAFADLCVGIFCVYQNIVTYLMDSWVFGEFMCKMYHFTNSLSTTASVLILVVICIERYLAIIHPMTCKQMLTKSRLRVTIALVWILSAAISSPRFYYFSTIKMPLPNNQLEILCLPNRTKYNSKLMDMLSMTLLFLIPLTIISILYTHIGIALWKSSSNRMNATSTPTPSGNDAPQCYCYAENTNLNINEPLPETEISSSNHLKIQNFKPNTQKNITQIKKSPQKQLSGRSTAKGRFSLQNFSWLTRVKAEKVLKPDCLYPDISIVPLKDESLVPQNADEQTSNQKEAETSLSFNKSVYSYIKVPGESLQPEVASPVFVKGESEMHAQNASDFAKSGKELNNMRGHKVLEDFQCQYSPEPELVKNSPSASKTSNQNKITRPSSNPIRHQNRLKRLVSFNMKSSLSLDSCSELGSLEQIYGEKQESSSHQLCKCSCSTAHHNHMLTTLRSGNCACSSGQCQLKDLERKKRGRRVRITRSNRNGTSALLARKKIVRMLIVVVLAFAICHLPFHARKVWQYWSPKWAQYEAGSVFSTLFTPITFLIMYANSAMNPILYAFMSKKFQMSFKDLLCCKLRRSLKFSSNKLVKDS